MSACCSSVSPDCSEETSAQDSSSREKQWLHLGIAGLIAAQTMVFSLAINLSPPEPSSRPIIHAFLAFSALSVFFFLGKPLLRQSTIAIKARRISIELLFLLGMMGAFTASVLSSVTGKGSVYYEVVAILLGIYTFGQLLGEKRRLQIGEVSRRFALEFSTCHRLLANGGTEEVKVEAIQAGDRVRVGSGESIAVDGFISRGSAYIQETSLTGEPLPVVKKCGDKVLAGSRVIDAELEITSSSPGTTRLIDHLLQEINQAGERSSGLQKEADRLMSWFIPLVVTLSLATFLGWLYVKPWEIALFNAMAVLLVACPCAMGLATPIGMWSALNALAARGWRVRNPEFIERLAQVNMVVFDKTGTLTEQSLSFVEVYWNAHYPTQELWSWVEAVQRQSLHPVARAFHRPPSDSPSSQAQVLSLDSVPAVGVKAFIEASGDSSPLELEIGNQSLLVDEDLEEAQKLRAMSQSAQATHEIWIKVNGQLCGLAKLKELLRQNTDIVLERLKLSGLEVRLMSGDRAESFEALGTTLSRIETVSSLSPTEKALQVRNLQSGGKKILFVGDGINDAPALAEAHASLSLAHAEPLTQSSSQATMQVLDLLSLPLMINLARHTVQGLKTNLLFAGAYNLIGILLAASGLLHPVAAALLMLTASFTVTTRALWFGSRLDKPAPIQVKSPGVISNVFPYLRRLSPMAFAVALGFVIQSLQLAHLGNLSVAPSSLILIGGLLAAGMTLAFWPRLEFRPRFQMALLMVGLGNLGMLIGWWADAGFGPIIREGVCLCGCPKSSLGQGLVWHFSTMHAGMLLFCFPLMLLLEDRQSRLFDSIALKWIHAFYVTGGMLAGMWAAAALLSLLPTISAQKQFYLTYAGMGTGMLLGMFAACSLWPGSFKVQYPLSSLHNTRVKNPNPLGS